MAKPKDVLGLAKDKNAVMGDLKFMDFIGLWQHFTIPIAELSEGIFDEGLGFDGSSNRGWASGRPATPPRPTATARPPSSAPTWATSRATRKATSRWRRSTRSRTCAPRCAG